MAAADSSTESRSSTATLVGQVLDGRYRIIRRIGAGGMGAVYEAEHVSLRTRVAVKVLKDEMAAEETSRLRFLREARAAAAITSDHVVQITDFGVADGDIAYFVMEYLEGDDLERIVRDEGRISWPRARHILLQIAAALRAAHEEGTVHRDVKPGNVLVFDDPKRGLYDVVKVLDFGIAKVSFVDDELHGLTATGEAFGTPAYMAPELAEGCPAAPATDIYAFGILAYRILTGQLPFTGNNPYQIFARHLREQPEFPRTIEPSIPPAAEQVILRCLAKEPSDRFVDLAEVEAALLAIPVDSTAQTFALTLPLRRRHGPTRRPTTASTHSTEPLDDASTGRSMDVTTGGATMPPRSWLRSNALVLSMFLAIGVTAASVTAVLIGGDSGSSPSTVASTEDQLLPSELAEDAKVTMDPEAQQEQGSRVRTVDASTSEADAEDPTDAGTTTTTEPPQDPPPATTTTRPPKPAKKPPSPDALAMTAAKKSLRAACKPEAKGYKVSIFVRPNGKVLDVEITGGDPAKHSCLETVMKAQPFPEGEGRKLSFSL